MNTPDISIITPSLNQGQFLVRTLESVHQQTHFSIEHWVIDGGSTDNTTTILQEYQDKIHFIIEPDKGQASAINKGFKRAQADIIGWLNSDDRYYPQTLKTVIEYFHAHPEDNILYGRTHWINEHDVIIGTYPTQAWDPQKLRYNCFISQPAVFFRKKIFSQYGYLNENLHFCMDYEFWLRMAQAGEKFAYLDQFLAQTRLHPACKTISRKTEAILETFQVRGPWATLRAALMKI